MLLTTAGTFLNTKPFLSENTLVAGSNLLSRNIINLVGSGGTFSSLPIHYLLHSCCTIQKKSLLLTVLQPIIKILNQSLLFKEQNVPIVQHQVFTQKKTLYPKCAG
jgi:hypothetical protein